jgi:hypothetical protein
VVGYRDCLRQLAALPHFGPDGHDHCNNNDTRKQGIPEQSLSTAIAGDLGGGFDHCSHHNDNTTFYYLLMDDVMMCDTPEQASLFSFFLIFGNFPEIKL